MVFLWRGDADGCRRWGIKNRPGFVGFGNEKQVAKNGIGLKDGINCRVLETGLRNFRNPCETREGFQIFATLAKVLGRHILMLQSGSDQHSFPCFKNITTSCKK